MEKFNFLKSIVRSQGLSLHFDSAFFIGFFILLSINVLYSNFLDTRRRLKKKRTVNLSPKFVFSFVSELAFNFHLTCTLVFQSRCKCLCELRVTLKKISSSSDRLLAKRKRSKKENLMVILIYGKMDRLL